MGVISRVLALLMNARVEDLRHRPKHTQNQQDAYKRRQMGDGLEDRHEDQSAHAKEKDGLTLTI